MSDPTIKTAFILGAGLGTRLRPLTEECPKPLLPIGGRPIITYSMEHLMTAGIKRFIVNTHHRADVYQRVFPDGGWRGVPIIFRHEPALLDTAGGLKNIEDLLEDDAHIIVYNGDVISTLPLDRLLHVHKTGNAEVTLALRSHGHPLQITVNTRNEVCDLRNTLGRKGRVCLFTGIYAVNRRFLERLMPGRRESVVDVFLRMIQDRAGTVGGAIIDEGYWYDAGSIEEYERLNRLLSTEGGTRP